MSTASDIERVPHNRLSGSKAVDETLLKFCAEVAALGGDWRDFVRPSGAVTLAGHAWERALQGLMSSESESVLGVRVIGGGGVQYFSPSDLEQLQRAHDAIALLDEWLADDSGYDEETWPELKESLDRDRLSDRRLFDG